MDMDEFQEFVSKFEEADDFEKGRMLIALWQRWGAQVGFCKWCGKSIIQDLFKNKIWRHYNDKYELDTGCYGASWNWDTGSWDKSIPRHRKATLQLIQEMVE